MVLNNNLYDAPTNQILDACCTGHVLNTHNTHVIGQVHLVLSCTCKLFCQSCLLTLLMSPKDRNCKLIELN